jgi:hypothetical protein
MKTGTTDLNPTERTLALSDLAGYTFLTINNLECRVDQSQGNNTRVCRTEQRRSLRLPISSAHTGLNRKKSWGTFVYYERLYILPALTNFPPISGLAFDRFHVVLKISIAQPDPSPGVKCDAIDIHGGHTGRGSDGHIRISVTTTSPADDLPQQHGLARSCDIRY